MDCLVNKPSPSFAVVKALLYSKRLILLVRPAGFEPTTPGLGIYKSIYRQGAKLLLIKIDTKLPTT